MHQGMRRGIHFGMGVLGAQSGKGRKGYCVVEFMDPCRFRRKVSHAGYRAMHEAVALWRVCAASVRRVA